MEIVNKNKEDMDNDDLGDNINKVAIEGNLSPKQIQSLNAKHGKQHKRSRNTSGSIDKESYVKIYIKMNALIQNIGPVNTRKKFTWLITMHKRHQFWFIPLMELFQEI